MILTTAPTRRHNGWMEHRGEGLALSPYASGWLQSTRASHYTLYSDFLSYQTRPRGKKKFSVAGSASPPTTLSVNAPVNGRLGGTDNLSRSQQANGHMGHMANGQALHQSLSSWSLSPRPC